MIDLFLVSRTVFSLGYILGAIIGHQSIRLVGFTLSMACCLIMVGEVLGISIIKYLKWFYKLNAIKYWLKSIKKYKKVFNRISVKIITRQRNLWKDKFSEQRVSINRVRKLPMIWQSWPKNRSYCSLFSRWPRSQISNSLRASICISMQCTCRNAIWPIAKSWCTSVHFLIMFTLSHLNYSFLLLRICFHFAIALMSNF